MDEPDQHTRGNGGGGNKPGPTYRLLQEFKEQLLKLTIQVQNFVDQRAEAESDHKDHEARLRVLEAFQVATLAAKNQSSTQWSWMGSAVHIAISLVTVAILYHTH